ncbi:MAG: hypothetical protein JWP41_3439 [Ramlibacter sp.]|nr:hypothetical protein [Ramlibacter sp.]
MSAPFKALADIEALERTPYDEAIPARSTYGLIAAAAARFPGHSAFVYLPDGELATAPVAVSYAELVANIHRAANLFRRLGVGPGDAVAILAPNIPTAQYALWGAQLAGCACPVNFMLQPEHIGALLQASGAKVVVALGPHRDVDIWGMLQRVPGIAQLTVLRIDPSLAPDAQSFQAALHAEPAELAFAPDAGPDRVAALFHTGGTTGAPKLVRHTHGNEAHAAWFAHRFYDFDKCTVEINGFPLFHVAGAFVYGLALLAVGATQVLPTVTGLRNAAFMRSYWKFCQRERVTALACVPTVLAALSNLPIDADISSIRVAYTGGSPLPSELAARFETVTGIPVRNILGMTESAGLVSIEPFLAPRVAGSAGLRLPYTQVRVVPWREGRAVVEQECAAGETGVLVLRGPNVSPGYTDASRDAGMFDQGWLVSGDLGYIDDAGYVHVTGRAKDVIIRGSHNIDPGLVEDAFLAHAAVALCAVVGEPDPHAGEVPAAFVTLKPGMRVSAEDLLAAVAGQVYERPAVPRRVVVLDALPVTAIGKIYKPALRLRAAELKLHEVFTAALPGVQMRVVAREQGGGCGVEVTVLAPRDARVEDRLRKSLGAIAVPTSFRFAG